MRSILKRLSGRHTTAVAYLAQQPTPSSARSAWGAWA